MIEIIRRGSKREDRRRKFYCTRCDSDWIADETDYQVYNRKYNDGFTELKKQYLFMPCPICGYTSMVEEFLGRNFDD